jgi:hypothetical protein
MSLTSPMAVSVFLLGAASGALLVSLRYAGLRGRLHAEAAEDLRRALFRKHREPASDRGNVRVCAAESDLCEFAARATDDRTGWP